MKTLKIVSFGNSNSGKTNYLSCALRFITKKYRKKLQLLGNNTFFQNFIGDATKNLPNGKWVNKTPSRNIFDFKIKKIRNDSNTSLSLWENILMVLIIILAIVFFPITIIWLLCRDDDEKNVTIHDWMGDAFEAMDYETSTASRGVSIGGDMCIPQNLFAKWKEMKLEPSLLHEFVNDINTADCFMIFIDSAVLFSPDAKSLISRRLAGFTELLRMRKELPGFDIVVSKADQLEGIAAFSMKRAGKTMLDLDKIEKELREEFDFFFNYLEWMHCDKCTISLVSCVPKPDHRRVDPERGVIPNEKWTLDDLEVENAFSSVKLRQTNQLYPFSWILHNFLN